MRKSIAEFINVKILFNVPKEMFINDAKSSLAVPVWRGCQMRAEDLFKTIMYA